MIQNYNNIVDYNMGAKKRKYDSPYDTMLISKLTSVIEPMPSPNFHDEKSSLQKWSDQPGLIS